MSFVSLYMRRGFAKSDKARDAGLSTPENVIRYDDIQYGANRKWQILDVYRPREKEGKLPVIISIHGGGWVYGDKEVYQFYCMSLAQRGFAVINFTYRLSPEFKYPAQVEDTDAVVKWMLDNGDKYGFDTDNVFAVGDSAGGHLLSVYSLILTNREYRQNYYITPPVNFHFNAIALNCGVYRQEMPSKKDMKKSLLNDMLPKGWGEKELEVLNTYDKITEGFPPAFVMSANGDFLRDQVDLIVPELEKHNVEHEVHIYGTPDNQLGHVFHCNIRFIAAKQCNDDECEFFRRHMK